jgi:cytoskeletal protein RodZ
MSSSKGALAKTLLCVAVPSLVAGYFWWQVRGAEDSKPPSSESVTEETTQNMENENDALSSSTSSSASKTESEQVTNNTNTKYDQLIESMSSACGSSSIIGAQVKNSKDGKGRGLFTTKRTENAELILRVRPSLTLLFEPYCSTHCLGCYASLQQVPGRQCQKCNRFAVKHLGG